jgi:futalosine hydrolase
MTILVVAATIGELFPLIDFLDSHWTKKSPGVYQQERTTIQIVVTGPGLTATAFALGFYFGQAKPDLAINAGVAGALTRELTNGEVVEVTEEVFADLGAEEADGSRMDLFQMDLLMPDTLPFQEGKLRAPHHAFAKDLPKVAGITVNMVHGSQPSIDRVKARYPKASIETMEGAAFFYACLIAEVPFIQIRAISNAVEPRDRSKWELSLAINNLSDSLKAILESLT